MGLFDLFSKKQRKRAQKLKPPPCLAAPINTPIVASIDHLYRSCVLETIAKNRYEMHKSDAIFL